MEHSGHTGGGSSCGTRRTILGLFGVGWVSGQPAWRLIGAGGGGGGGASTDVELATGDGLALLSADCRVASQGPTSVRSYESPMLADVEHPGGAGTGLAVVPAMGLGWQGVDPWEGLRTRRIMGGRSWSPRLLSGAVFAVLA